MVNSGFYIKTLADVDVQGMTLIICKGEQEIAEITYDNGIENINIQLLRNNSLSEHLNLESFVDILQQAKERARAYAKEDDEFRRKGIDI